LITALLYWIYPRADLLHLAIWTSVAVVLHVFVDIFNAYGTQALRPFSQKWIALGMINTFDPILFLIYTAGIVVWIFGAPEGYTFLTVFIVAFGYYILRYIMKRRIVHKIHEKYGDVEKIIISPTMKFRKWRIAIISKNHYYVGRSLNNELTILDEYDRVPVPQTDVIKAAERDENISAFLSFSPVYRWEVDEYTDHYEVKFIDLRYRSKGHYPFVAIVQLDQDLNIVSSYTGWIFSEEKLRKKLDLLPE
jgi:inner membrane protein